MQRMYAQANRFRKNERCGMREYIDLKLALNKLWKLCVEDIDAEKSESETFDFSRARDALSALPTIDIVRCEKCENFIPTTHGCKRSPSVEPWWEDDFCSYGERIEE